MIQSNTNQIVSPATGLPVSSVPSSPYLEVRLNSVTDAKASVQNSGDIIASVKKFGLEGVEFLISKALEPEIQAVIGGAFNNVKTIYTRIVPRGTNVQYPLPAFIDFAASAKAKVAEGRSVEDPAVAQALPGVPGVLGAAILPQSETGDTELDAIAAANASAQAPAPRPRGRPPKAQPAAAAE